MRWAFWFPKGEGLCEGSAPYAGDLLSKAHPRGTQSTNNHWSTA